MKRFVFSLVFVVAVLAIHQASVAQDRAVPDAPGQATKVRPVSTQSSLPQMSPNLPPAGYVPSENSIAKFAAKRTGDARLSPSAFNGFSHIRATADLGAPGSAGNGFSHFMLPMDRYTNWYRPRAATLTQYQRCAPDSFHPRGFGNLFAKPCDGFRMEYEPYSLSDGMSTYGPSYIARMPDPRCPDCDPTAEDCEECRPCKR